MNASIVLLFNACADSSRAARLHSVDCPMTNTSGRRVIRIEGADLEHTIADLNARGFRTPQGHVVIVWGVAKPTIAQTGNA